MPKKPSQAPAAEKPEVVLEKKQASESPLLKDQIKAGEAPQPEQIVVSQGTSFLSRLAWLRLSIEEKAFITENILLDIKNSTLYWTQLIVSVAIATFGLLQNSVAVVIGAMLLAPLLNPIKGLAFGITTGQPSYFWQSVRMQVLSVAVAIYTAYLFSSMVPLKIETAEILARTSPNLLDLLIAIASGSIAILSLYFKKLSENISGVAMAASLMPPLAVVGIELSLGHYFLASGGLFLFVTNLFAILSVGVIIFLFYGFFPDQEDTKQRSLRITAILFILLFFISFPLYSSLTNIGEKINLKVQANQIFTASLNEQLPGAKLGALLVESFDRKNVKFNGSIRLPEGANFEPSLQKAISEKVSLAVKRHVIFDLDVTPVIQIESK